jgi:hypothetical protein
MLAGIVGPADVPPGFEAVSELLTTARASARRPVQGTVLSPAIVDSRRTPGRARGRRSMLATTPSKPRLSILAAAMALSAMTGAACAAGLPSAASARAAAVLQDIGIGTRASPAQAPAARAANHGDTVSTAAKTTTASGVVKGALISGIAGDGRSHMGRNGDGAGAADRGEGSGSSGHGKGARVDQGTGPAPVRRATAGRPA